ncbi:MAG TPA: NAD(P)/FAD-dependent oxidoreductase [Thermoleophilaceae bacterium]|nr:NAD(P)/FAD-dependent oxidoreductase [Thermoleophilaceae bacterium]
MTRLRALVIGAGHNGLLCAGTLAEAGWDVTVVEQAPHPGGGVHSVEGPLPGFVTDVCAGFFPLTRASPAFEGIDLERLGVEWVTPPIAMVHPLPDGRSITLHRELEPTVASLEAVRPGAGRAWAGLVEPLLRNERLVRRTALAPLPPLAPAVALAVRLRRSAIELARLLAGSAATLGERGLGGEEPAAWLGGSAVHSDLSPDTTGSAAFGFFLHLLGHMVGWPFPRGGAERLTGALVRRLVAAGGTVRCESGVERIDRAGGRARGAVLADGTRLGADAVVSTVSIRPLLRMLPPDSMPTPVARELGRWRYGLATFKVDFALSAPVPWRAEEARRAAVVHVGGYLRDQIAAARAAGLGQVPPRPSMVVGQHSLHDSSRAPDGQHTLYVYTHIPARHGEEDATVADLMEERIEEFAPGFRELVLSRSVRSPQDLERENASLVGGDLAGGSAEIDQQLVFRPALELARYRTPLPGLYVAGASNHPGPGVHGVPGAAAARAVRADASGLRPWRRLRGKPSQSFARPS